MKDPCINIKYSSSSSRYFTSIISTYLTSGTYTALGYLFVEVFSVTKSQFNKQSAELSILLTLSKHFTYPKFVFAFDLISSSIEFSITKKKKNWQKIVSCFLATILKSDYEDLHFSKDSCMRLLSLIVRYRRYCRQD